MWPRLMPVELIIQTGQMVKTAAQHPAQALAYINKAIRELAQLTNDPTVKAFDMEIEDSCVEVVSCESDLPLSAKHQEMCLLHMQSLCLPA